MSATNRGSERSPNDFYATPHWCTRRLLEHWLPRATNILDPCAGEGDILRACGDAMPAYGQKSLHAVELRPECGSMIREVNGISSVTIGDFLNKEIHTNVNDTVIITNPPYSLTVPFLEKSIQLASAVAFLLRINAIRGDLREDLMRRLSPGLFVLPDRPSFTGYGTDATEYAWFVFGDPKCSGRWYMLDRTPLSDRSIWNSEARRRWRGPSVIGPGDPR